MRLTVSVVIHKTPFEQISKLADSLLRSDIETIYIVDNSPQIMPYSNILESLSPAIKYIKTENNGFGAAHNVAIREVLARNDLPDDFHLVVNPDVYWEDDVLHSLVEEMKRNEKIGMIMPKIFYPDGDLQLSCRRLPSPFDLFLKRLMPPSLKKKRMEKYLLEVHDHDRPLNCPYLLGSFLLFRNVALKSEGIFDERFFMYPEDIDITRRIHRNWITLYWPEVSVIHEHAAASRKSIKMFRIHFVNMVKYFNKWGWFCDKERKSFNKKLMQNVKYIEPSKRPPSRG